MWYNTAMRTLTPAPKNWPTGWPAIPETWHPRIDPDNPNGIAVDALASITFPEGGTLRYPLTSIDTQTGDTNEWRWWDENRDHVVTGPPVIAQDPTGQYDWHWETDDGIRGEVRAHRPAVDGPIVRG